MKIWVLAKKDNFELYNNSRFIAVAKEEGLDVTLVSPEDFELIVTKDNKKTIYYNGKETSLPDCFIPRMGSGTTYFALAIIRYMENNGVFVLNSSESIETAKDKLASLQKLTRNNIPVPQTMLAKFPVNINIIKDYFSFPIIIKTISGSLGKGVFLAETKSKLQDLIDLVESSKDPKVNLIFQEFISSSKGRDIRVIVVGGRAIGAILRTAKRGKFKANYSAGASATEYNLNPAVEWLAVESAKILDLEIAGVDILFDGDNYKVCEVNSSPMFEGFESATKIDFPKKVYEYIRIRLADKS